MKKIPTVLIAVICFIPILIMLFAFYRNDKPAASGFTSDVLPASKLENLELNDSIVLEDGATLTKTTYSNYVNQMSNTKDITLDKAKILDNNALITTFSNGGYSYFYYTKVFSLENPDVGEFQAQLNAILELYTCNSYAQIENVIAISTSFVAGPNNCEWVESSAYSYTEKDKDSFPVGKVNLFGDGYFQIKYKLPLGILPEMIWTSETLHMRGSYQCYNGI